MYLAPITSSVINQLWGHSLLNKPAILVVGTGKVNCHLTVWDFDEEDLQSTGKFVPENYNMTGESIRVVVNEKGEGEIKED